MCYFHSQKKLGNYVEENDVIKFKKFGNKGFSLITFVAFEFEVS